MSSDPRLARLLRQAADDVFFCALSIDEDVDDVLDELAARRRDLYDAIIQEPVDSPRALGIAGGDDWLRGLVKALVPIAVPRFLPMRSAISDGFSLLAEPRGLRAVLPIGREGALQRVGREGAYALRVLRSVSCSDGPLTPEEARAIDLCLAAIALPNDDMLVLAAEGPADLAALTIPEGMESRTARAIVQGAFDAAASDGLADEERAALRVVEQRLAVPSTFLDQVERDSVTTRARRRLGALAVLDALRYVGAPLEAEMVQNILETAVFLLVALVDRSELLRLALSDEVTPLSRQHVVDKDTRYAALCASWALALRSDPTTTMRSKLELRHDRVGRELGAEKLTVQARRDVDGHIHRSLSRAGGLIGA